MSATGITIQTSLLPPRVFTLLDGTGPVGCSDENRVPFTGLADPDEGAYASIGG
jgi:hypothetical protein